MRALLIVATVGTVGLGTAIDVAAQCACGLTSQSSPYDLKYRIETQNPVPLGDMLTQAETAATKWNQQLTTRNTNASVQQGAGGIRIVVTDAIQDGQAHWDPTSNPLDPKIIVPEEWITKTDPPFLSAYIMAVLLHEIGHALGFAHSACAGASVMSNTNLSSYRTNFTNCDRQHLNYQFGTAPGDDPCEFGCGPGYTTNCVGDQTPDECGCCVDYSPIVLDIDGGGVRFSDAAHGAMFAINDQGNVLWVGWPTKPGNAWLALDRNGDGTINHGAELFGNTTRLSNGRPATHGYEALAEFDGNRDRIIDRQDAIFGSLRLWMDGNRDGTSQPHELISLRRAGVAWLSTEARESARVDQWGNRFALRARVGFVSGAKSFSYDVYPVTMMPDGSSAACSTRPGPLLASASASASPSIMTLGLLLMPGLVVGGVLFNIKSNARS